MLIQKSVLIAQPVEHMFDLVENIEHYPDFLPWCAGASRTTVAVLPQRKAQAQATLQINYHGVRQSFTTLNTWERARCLEMRLVEGPFKVLEGAWYFKPLGQQGFKVEFNLHYEFSSTILAGLVVPVFNHIAGSFVDSFIQRAEQMYA